MISTAIAIAFGLVGQQVLANPTNNANNVGFNGNGNGGSNGEMVLLQNNGGGGNNMQEATVITSVGGNSSPQASE